MLGPLYPGARVGPYLKALKELQDSFGSLNDAAMAQADADRRRRRPAPADPAAQRGVGWVLGTLDVAARATTGRGSSTAGTGLREAKPFWR